MQSSTDSARNRYIYTIHRKNIEKKIRMLYGNEQAKVGAEKSEQRKKKSRKFRVLQYASIVAAFWLNFNWFSPSLFYPFASIGQHRTDKSEEKKERHKKPDLHLLSVRMVDVVLWFSTRKCSTWNNPLVNFVRRWMNWSRRMCVKRNKFQCAGHCLLFLHSIRLLVCCVFFSFSSLSVSLPISSFTLSSIGHVNELPNLIIVRSIFCVIGLAFWK